MCQSRWSGKDSLILVIDASQDMFKECDDSIPFQLCIKVLIIDLVLPIRNMVVAN